MSLKFSIKHPTNEHCSAKPFRQERLPAHHSGLTKLRPFFFLDADYWTVQWSWFTQVNALCNLPCRKLWKVTAAISGPISEQALVYVVYNNGSLTYNCQAVQMPPLLQLQKLPGKGDERWKKSLCTTFQWTRKLRLHAKNAVWGIL